MNMRRLVPGGIVILVLMIAPIAEAQQLTIDWYSIGGGGGTSTGGSFTLNGVVGQPDAGVSTGGDFTLYGGFLGPAMGPLPTYYRDADEDGYGERIRGVVQREAAR